MTTTADAPASQLQFLLPADGDRLVLTVTEAGRLLGISRTFAYELATRGELPVIRLGRRLLVLKRPLLELVGAATADGTWPALASPDVHSDGQPGTELHRATAAPAVAST